MDITPSAIRRNNDITPGAIRYVEPMKVWIILWNESADPAERDNIIGVYGSREQAERHLHGDSKYYTIEEHEVE